MILISGAAKEVQRSSGRFARMRKPWTLDSWDDGYVNKGRFNVYRPDYPRAWDNGYARRSHIVWWLATGEVPLVGFVVHHKNGDKLDDRFENLEVIDHSKHITLHCKKPAIIKICKYCGQAFQVDRKRGLDRANNRNYCSLECYYQMPKSLGTRDKQSQSLQRNYANDQKRAPLQKGIIRILQQGLPLKVKELAYKLNYSPAAVGHTLATMLKRSQLFRIGRGLYSLTMENYK